MIIAVTGIRDLDLGSLPAVELAAIEAASESDEMRFGGAIGSDTVALKAASGRTRCVVIVPHRVADQPHEARAAIRQCANTVREMQHQNFPMPEAYYARNDALLDGADRLLAFTDGSESGGTWWTIKRAASRGIPVDIVHVRRNAHSRRR